MAFIEWDEELTLGDPVIDRQHKGLVELINQMHSHLDSQDRDELVMHCLTTMYLYAKDHFQDEEALMLRIGYPEREHHAALHREFVQKTHDLTDCCLSDNSTYTDLLDFLVSWFHEHLATVDAKMVAFAKACKPF